MPTDRFTQAEFEAALPAVPFTTQWVKGELVYYIPVFFSTNGQATNKRIVVRSSIDRSGYAADTGQDSIRHWVEYSYKGKWCPLAKADKMYTTRVAGWGERLTAALKELWLVALNDSKKGASNGSVDFTTKSNHDTKHESRETMAHQKLRGQILDDDAMRQMVRNSESRDSGNRGFDTKRDLPAVSRDSPSSTEPDDPFAFLGDKTEALPEPDGESASSNDPRAVGSDDGAGVDELGHRITLVRDVSTRANAQQLIAIEADPHKPLRVLAPPGAGKTFLMSYRYAHLLSCGAKPEQIVAVTFNRTMADELLARISRVNPELKTLLDTEPDNDAVRQICTIHALCFRILRSEGDRREVPGKGRVKHWMLKAELEKIIEDLWPIINYRPGWKEVMAYIDGVKARGLDSAHDMELFADVRDKYGNLVGQQIHQARRRFDEWCQKNRIVQFSDMLYDVDLRLQRDAAFRIRWQAKYQYMLIDEGQDTSAQAMRILTTLIAPQNQITIVGDTDQLLYRFTGATPEANLYEGFEERYPDGKLVKLEINYRSNRKIIDAYSTLILNNYAPLGPYDQKYFKNILARDDAPEGEPVSFQMYFDAVDEAKGVVTQIKQLIDGGRKPGDFFIGSRTYAQTGYLEGPLVQAGIPYINLIGTSFWTLKHIADVISYIRLAFDENDSKAFQQVYNIASTDMLYPWGEHKGEYCQHRFLGQKFLDACFDSETHQPQYKWRWQAATKRRSYQPGVQDLELLISELQGILAFDDIAKAIDYVIENCYQKYLQASEGLTDDDASSNGKLDDIETVKDLSREFGQDVSAFLEYVNKAITAAEAAQNGDWSEHVVISTVHRLKGLERPIVFGVGLVEGVDKQGQEVGLLPHTYSMRPPSIQGMLPTGGQGRIEDERDICYVLISRAQEEVYLTGCSHYRTYKMWPSRFIEEMGLLPDTTEYGGENE